MVYEEAKSRVVYTGDVVIRQGDIQTKSPEATLLLADGRTDDREHVGGRAGRGAAGAAARATASRGTYTPGDRDDGARRARRSCCTDPTSRSRAASLTFHVGDDRILRRRPRAGPHRDDHPAQGAAPALSAARSPAAPAGPRVLRAAGLTKSYGRRVVVRTWTSRSAPGEVVGLLGPERRGQDHDLLHGGRAWPGPTAARSSWATRTSPRCPCTCGRARASATCRRRRASSASSPRSRTCCAILETLRAAAGRAARAGARAARGARDPGHGAPARLHAVRGRAAPAGDLPRPRHLARPSSCSTSRSRASTPSRCIDIQKIIAHLQGPRDRRPDHGPQRARDLENHGSRLYSQGRRGLPLRNAAASWPPTRRSAGSTSARPSGWTTARR